MGSTRHAGRSTLGWRHAVVCIFGAVALTLNVAACEETCAVYDYSACSIDGCSNGQPTHEIMPGGAECLVGSKHGICASGFCAVPCSNAGQCDDGDPCTTNLCQGGVCINAGGATFEASGTCLLGICVAGVQKSIQKTDGTPCGTAGGECDHGVCSKCAPNSDCGHKTACDDWFCDQGECTRYLFAAGTPVAEVIPFDCKRHVCDGHGNIVMQANENDRPFPTDETCMQQTCEGWTAVFVPRTAGSKCKTQGGPDGVCDGNGECVDCVYNTDCPDWKYYCFGGKCSRCDDGMQNGDETGVDCGNLPCGACLGTPCATGATCKSGYCQDGMCCEIATCGICKTCAAPNTPGKCTDIPAGQEDPAGCTGMKACNGGGLCKTKNGYTCGSGTDCISNKCVGGICLP